MTPDQILDRVILRGVVGSTSLGTNLPGTDDRDEMGICLEPMEYVVGLEHFTHYIHRDQPEGVRSQPGDLDLTIYGLHRFCDLAVKGNPSILGFLYLPEYTIIEPLGLELIRIREAFYSHDAGQAFLGYTKGQLASLMGDRNKKVNRPELVEKYGFDTKFAMHALRLASQGIEYMTTRHITLPLPEPEREFLLAVRTGKYSLVEILAIAHDRLALLSEAVSKCQAKADRDTVNAFLIRVFQ